MSSYSKRSLSVTVFTCAALGFANTAAVGSSAWWIGADDARYSTALGILPSFADPAIIQVGNKYYAYATNNRKGINVQVAVSSDFRTWQTLNIDALPNAGSWTYKEPRVWAPDVRKNNQGKYVLYYSAMPSWRIARHCLGTAIADTPIGPFIPSKTSFACPLSQGGAIDSSGFRDPRTGRLYVLYKIDGNADGKGGMCNNMKSPQHPTPIMLQQVTDDGISRIGTPVQILDRVAQDGPLVEAPSLLYDPSSGRYILFYSSGCYADPVYDTAYVFSAGSDIRGPYNRVKPASKPAQDGGKPSQRLYKGGIDGLHAPGGATAIRCSDGVARMVIHGYTNGQGRRSMYTARLQVNAQQQSVTAWSLSEAISLGYRNNTLTADDPNSRIDTRPSSSDADPIRTNFSSSIASAVSGSISTNAPITSAITSSASLISSAASQITSVSQDSSALLSAASSTDLSPSQVLAIASIIATDLSAASSIDAVAATATIWDNTTPTVIAGADSGNSATANGENGDASSDTRPHSRTWLVTITGLVSFAIFAVVVVCFSVPKVRVWMSALIIRLKMVWKDRLKPKCRRKKGQKQRRRAKGHGRGSSSLDGVEAGRGIRDKPRFGSLAHSHDA